MSLLAPLLETQELDLAADAARKRSLELPERADLPRLAERDVGIDREIAAIRAERAAVEAEEGELGRAVSQIVKDIEAAELERYSGRSVDRDAAAEHDAAQAARREKQAAFEEREMELLEAAEALDERLGAHESEKARIRTEQGRLEEVVRKVESEVAAELARLSEERAGIVAELPSPVLAAYERVRARAQSHGRGAAPLAERRCGACRIELPSLELRTMLAQSEDALLQCPQCRRVLVRGD